MLGHNASAVLPLRSSDSVSQRRNWSLLLICSAGESSGDKNLFLLCWYEQLQKGYPPVCSGESCSVFEFESKPLAHPLLKHQKIWSTSVQMQSGSSKASVLSNSCCFLLLLVCSAKDLLLRMAQHEWLSMDFILVHGHASFYSERGAERHSREKQGWSSLPLSL